MVRVYVREHTKIYSNKPDEETIKKYSFRINKKVQNICGQDIIDTIYKMHDRLIKKKVILVQFKKYDRMFSAVINNDTDLSKYYSNNDENICIEICYKYCVYVKDLFGKTKTIGNCKKKMEIKELYEKMETLLNLPIEQQRPVCNGYQLAYDTYSTLDDYKIYPDCTIHMCLPLRGGMFSQESGKNGSYDELESETNKDKK